MKFALSWLKALLDTKADARTIAEKLTALGLEIESPRATGMHAMLRVKERSGANGAT